LVTDDDHGLAVDTAYSSNNGCIVGKSPITMELEEVFAQYPHIVEGAWALDVARYLDFIPGGEWRLHAVTSHISR
jgi:hypothetical protein